MDLGGAAGKKAVGMLARKIQGAHGVLQAFTGLPLAVTEDEATELAIAVTQVTKEFGVVISGKAAAIANLAATAAMIYGPKIAMIYFAIQSERAKTVNASEPDQPIPEPVKAGATDNGNVTELRFG